MLETLRDIPFLSFLSTSLVKTEKELKNVKIIPLPTKFSLKKNYHSVYYLVLGGCGRNAAKNYYSVCCRFGLCGCQNKAMSSINSVEL